MLATIVLACCLCLFAVTVVCDPDATHLLVCHTPSHATPAPPAQRLYALSRAVAAPAPGLRRAPTVTWLAASASHRNDTSGGRRWRAVAMPSVATGADVHRALVQSLYPWYPPHQGQGEGYQGDASARVVVVCWHSDALCIDGARRADLPYALVYPDRAGNRALCQPPSCAMRTDRVFVYGGYSAG